MSDGVNGLQRFAVIGTSCSGKTTFARALAQSLCVSHIHLDELYWGPDWTPRPLEGVRRRLDAATAQPRWVCDGNYSSLRDLIWPRAEAVIWLNYPLRTVMSRAIRRTVRRVWTREPLYAGSRETFRRSFLSRDSILLWALQTHERHRSEYPRLLATPEHAHLKVFELQDAVITDACLRFLQCQRSFRASAHEAAGKTSYDSNHECPQEIEWMVRTLDFRL